MKPEEIKKHLGTEFTYIYEDGDRVKAYIKVYDPKIGMSCFTLADKTRDGWTPGAHKKIEEDGSWCVIGVDLRVHPESMLVDRVKEIIETGKFDVRKQNKTGLGFANCAF